MQAAIDNAIFEVFSSQGYEDGGRDEAGLVITDGKLKSEITADESDGPIPVLIRYGSGDKDGSESIKLVLEIDTDSVGTGADALKFVYNDGGVFNYLTSDQVTITDDGETTSYTFSNLASSNDTIIKGLHVIPQKNHVPEDGIEITAKIFVSDSGLDFVEQASKQFVIDIIDRADIFDD